MYQIRALLVVTPGHSPPESSGTGLAPRRPRSTHRHSNSPHAPDSRGRCGSRARPPVHRHEQGARMPLTSQENVYAGRYSQATRPRDPAIGDLALCSELESVLVRRETWRGLHKAASTTSHRTPDGRSECPESPVSGRVRGPRAHRGRWRRIRVEESDNAHQGPQRESAAAGDAGANGGAGVSVSACSRGHRTTAVCTSRFVTPRRGGPAVASTTSLRRCSPSSCGNR